MSDARTTSAGGGSLNGTQLPETFFQSDNLLRVLAAVRGAGIPDAERTAVRDAILTYAQSDGGEKAAARTALETTIVPHYAILTSHVTGAPQPVSPKTSQIGTPRPTPRFNTLAERPATTPPKPLASPQSKPEPTEMVPPKEEVPRAAPVAKQQLQPTSKQPTPKPVPAAASNTSHDAKTRIAEIKHAVNERVGNPVNLIEKDRSVGQEYMSALLSAIKGVSTPGGGVDAAMERLEKAFAAVEKLLADQKQSPVSQVPKTQSVAPKPEVKPQPAPPPPPPAPKQQSSIPIKPEAKPFADIARRAAAVQKPVSPPAEEKRVEPTPQPAPVTEQPAPLAAKQTDAPPPAEPKKEDAAAYSLSALRTKAKPDAGQGDGLTAPEVNAGLEQLLSEWTLFKSSGFLGTGPKGIQHPLYKKLANLPMAAVIAGRFEGATPEIKQNIADYMNGWRYEQGIVHRMDEQFEHYLRRVIRYILAKQTKAPAGTTPEKK